MLQRILIAVDPAKRPSADDLLADLFIQKAPIGAKKFAAKAKRYRVERENARIQQELQAAREDDLSVHATHLCLE
ncbi:hypothetical protein AAVH_13536 [Aphelenchoides avenae]|nr:hypothetical protein AAVH_13536 [Aphelenchus avenae]